MQTDPGIFGNVHPGLYARAPEAVIALRRDGFVAGTGKCFEPRQRRGLAESIAVQMRDAKGAGPRPSDSSAQRSRRARESPSARRGSSASRFRARRER